MTADEILLKLKNELPFLQKKFDLEEIALYGSYARNEAKTTSDIDFLVKLKQPNFLKLAGLLNYLENIFRKKVDIISKHEGLSPRFLKRVEKEARYAR